jgi:hypothetical protein
MPAIVPPQPTLESRLDTVTDLLDQLANGVDPARCALHRNWLATVSTPRASRQPSLCVPKTSAPHP